MSEITVTEHEIRPYFDMEGFMTLSQESRLGGATLERLCKLWEEWMPQLKVCEIKTAKISYLAVWLPESVEQQVDAAWEKSPSDGWQDNNLAQYMCMAAVREALSGLGLEYREDAPTLNRRFALVTHYPFKGGCEICHLQSNCPKGQGKSEAASVVLPGYEQGADE